MLLEESIKVTYSKGFRDRLAAMTGEVTTGGLCAGAGRGARPPPASSEASASTSAVADMDSRNLSTARRSAEA